MRACAKNTNGGIVAIGNAPTALLEIIKMAKNIIDVAVASSRR